jgi:hypothetical protein
LLRYLFWIKAKGFYTIKSGIFSVSEDAFEEAYSARNSMKRKLEFIREEGLIKEYTYEFLNKVRERRNKVHPPSTFSKQDYILFQEAKALTNIMHPVIIFDLKEPWHKQQLDYVENRAKWLLEKMELFR